MTVSGKSDKAKPPVYHEKECERGWRIVHEHLSLDIDFEARKLRGTAVLSIRALNENCCVVALNLRRCRVLNCVVNGVTSEFTQSSALDDPLLLESVSDESNLHRNEDIKREHDMARVYLVDAPELHITVPPGEAANLVDDLLAAEREINGANIANIPKTPNAELHDLPKLTVSITYELCNPVRGATFYGSSKIEDALSNPMYLLTESRYGLARTWMPCVDTLNWCDRCFFDIDVTVSRDLVVVASGDLITTTEVTQPGNDDSGQRLMFRYRSTVPAHAREIVVAAGPFMPFSDPLLPNTVTHFCLPGHASELVHTSPPIFEKALAFCRDYFGFDPPCTSFKQLFVGPLGEEKSANYCAGGGLAVLSGNLLHTSRNIDAGFLAREAIVSTLVQSYIGCLLRPREANDAWIISGLSAHVTARGLRTILGHNWYRFRILDEMDALCQELPSESIMLAHVDPGVHVDLFAQRCQRKAHIVVYMIERRIGSDIMRRALRDLVAEGRNVIVALSAQLDRVRKTQENENITLRESMHNFAVKAFSTTPNSLELSKPANEADDDEDDEDVSPAASKRVGSNGAANGFDDGLLGIGVYHFMKRLRAICGTDVKVMVRLWASSRGVPRMQSSYRYHSRRHRIEFVAVQEAVEPNSLYKGKEGLQFAGTVNVRIMEVEGAYEHAVEIRDSLLTTELPCNSRRTKKAVSQTDKDVRDDPLRCSPIVFVRVDTDMEWCLDMNLKQPDSALIAMLQSERDSIAQYRACQALARCNDPAAVKALAAILEDDQVYWRVHAEAANSLVLCSGGLDALLAFCRSRYTDRGEDGRDNVRLNNFSNFSEYFVKRAIVKAIANAKEIKIGAIDRKILPQAVDFIMNMLMGNDNAGNVCDDDYYVADLITQAGRIAVESVGNQPQGISKEEDSSFSTRAMQEIARYRSLDRLIPSKTGAVTCAVIKASAIYEVARLTSLQKRGYGTPLENISRGQHRPNEELSRLLYDNCTSRSPLLVRIQALQSLALVYSGDLTVCLWLLNGVDRYHSGMDIINPKFAPSSNTSIETSESPKIRRAIMEGLNVAVRPKQWGGLTPPLITALRKNTKRAREICIRLRRLIVGDLDDHIRLTAYSFASQVWGVGAPVCLMGRTEYAKMCNLVARHGTNNPDMKKLIVADEMRKQIGVPLWSKAKRDFDTKQKRKIPKNKSSKNLKAQANSPTLLSNIPAVSLSSSIPVRDKKSLAIPLSKPNFVNKPKLPTKIPSSKPSPDLPTSLRSSAPPFKLPSSKQHASNKTFSKIVIPPSQPTNKPASKLEGSKNVPKVPLFALRSKAFSSKDRSKSDSPKDGSKSSSPKQAPKNLELLGGKNVAKHNISKGVSKKSGEKRQNKLSFSIDSLDSEDFCYMKKAWGECQRAPSMGELTLAERIVTGADQNAHPKDNTAALGINEPERGAMDADDEERRRKKKKKKKKKRKLEEGEGDEKKKKKKKKKKRHEGRDRSEHGHDAGGLDDEKTAGGSSRMHGKLTPEPLEKLKLKLSRSSVSAPRDAVSASRD